MQYRATAHWRSSNPQTRDNELRVWNSWNQEKRKKHIEVLKRKSKLADRDQALLSAVRDGEYEECARLLDAGVSPNCCAPQTDSVGLPGTNNTPLIQAVLGEQRLSKSPP